MINAKYADTSIICDLAEPHIYECTLCNMDIEVDCECIGDPKVQHVDVFCHNHNEVHEEICIADLIGLPDHEDWIIEDDETEDWDDWEENDENKEDDEPEDKLFGTKTYVKPRIKYYQKCRHYNVPVEFADGTTVYASSAHSREPVEAAPDWGLYLDSMWNPAGLAYLVDWRDYGLPTRYDTAAYAIIDSFNKATKGLWVEVGCIGGHGRTGTALACMAILGGMLPEDAINHVRTTYCEHTIESDDQLWFIEWFNVFVNGGNINRTLWNKKKKEWYVAKNYNYSTPLDWKNFDPMANPVGAPTKKTQQTVIVRDFSVPYIDQKDGKVRYFTVKPNDEAWQAVVNAYAVQLQEEENERIAEEAAKEAETNVQLAIL